MSWIYGLGGGVLLVVLVLFSIANRTVVTVNLWPMPFTSELPLALAILGGLLFGAAPVLVWATVRRWRDAWVIHRLRAQVAAQEKRLSILERQERAETSLAATAEE